MMRLLFCERRHRVGPNGDEYRVVCELVNDTSKNDEEIHFSKMFSIAVTREQWERFLPEKCLEFSDKVKGIETEPEPAGATVALQRGPLPRPAGSVLITPARLAALAKESMGDGRSSLLSGEVVELCRVYKIATSEAMQNALGPYGLTLLHDIYGRP